MNESKLREAFAKIREDMSSFQTEIQEIKQSLEYLDSQMRLLVLSTDTPTNQQTLQHSFYTENKAESNTNPQNSNTPTPIPTLQHHQEALKSPKIEVSTGNEGVPTHHPTIHPTNQQTLQHPLISTAKHDFSDKFTQKQGENQEKSIKIDRISRLQQVSEILSSLDELKKEVRIKFKRLTNQEMLIYSTIYQLDQLGLEVDYSLIAEKLNLTDTSIRDYVRKIISKGIPLDKTRENNKRILLKIPQNFKKVASLNTILELREL